MTICRTLTILSVACLAAGCHLMRPSCHGVEDYQAAIEAPPLRVPAGMDSPDVKEVLKIPASTGAPPPSRKDACLDEPPKYREAPRGGAAGR